MNNDLFIQYSHSITWDYSKGILPSGREPAWDWEESYIPVEHKQGSRTLGRHEFMRVKVGVQGVWSVPMRIVGLGIKGVSTVLKSSSEGTKTYAIETTYDDGTVAESSSLLTIVDGKDGKDGADAENYDTASEWFDTDTDLKAFTGYSNDQYYGIFENKSIYQYKSGATVGIKPDDITGNGRYVLVSDLTSGFADDSDMDENPMVLSTKAVAPSNLQYWWDNVKTDYYTGDEVDTLLSNKVDKETGKGLTSNDFTDTLKSKLDGIADGAEVNVNADWDAVSGDAQILNKPSTFTPSAHNHAISDVTNLQDALDDKLDKSLTLGKIWVGDEDNLPVEANMPQITVGPTLGAFPSISAAVDAGYYNLVAVESFTDTGDISDDFYIVGYSQATAIVLSGTVTGVVGVSNLQIEFSCVNLYGAIVATQADVNIRCPVSSTSAVFIGTNNSISFSSGTVITGGFSVSGDVDGVYFNTNADILLQNCNATGVIGGGYTVNITMNNSSIELSGDITKLILQNNNNKPNSVFTGIALTSIEFTPGNNYVRDSYFYNSTFIYPYPSSTNIYYSNCEFSTNTAFTVANKGEFTDCIFSGGASLVLAVPLIRIIGGESSVPIQITGNNVSISNIIAPSISLGAVTGCNIVNNYVDTTMTIVPGNNFSNNIEY